MAQLTGSIPVSLGSQSKLTHLELNNNRFSSTIPSSLGKLNLIVLNLAFNKLQSTIPQALENLRGVMYGTSTIAARPWLFRLTTNESTDSMYQRPTTQRAALSIAAVSAAQALRVLRQSHIQRVRMPAAFVVRCPSDR